MRPESVTESKGTENDIESMESLANEYILEQEDASGNVGESENLFEDSSSSDYDQLWVVNE